ncbi:MAG: CPBP family intramembrane metalloprotease [Chlamydiae bacterium]|nr:CPBP family intramembrane metalloprotease [Chlamydiota bacterium]
MAKGVILLYKLFAPETKIPILAFSFIQFTTLALVILSIYFYSKFRDELLLKRIFKDFSIPNPSSITSDIFSGCITWSIGFPVSCVVSQLSDLAIYLLYGYQSYEQMAVKYLKATLESPLMLAIAIFTIIIAAPLTEEFLFRGMLQTWLKNKLGSKPAILIASLCFALFHVSSSQGLGNITLVLSLFSFACFLGFIYEKKASLYASIALHMTFNSISTFRILFFTDS